jgi:alpha-amylase
MMSLGVSGFRIDAGKHMSPEDEADIFRRVQLRMGGRLPPDFIAWLEVLTGEQADVLWYGPSWYGTRLANRLLDALGAESELDKIKLFDSGYPVKPWENRAVSSHRIVIQNDDHDSQSPVFYRGRRESQRF